MNKTILVKCPICHKIRIIRERTTLSDVYTGMCKTCMLRSPNNLSKNLHHTKPLGADIKIQGYVQLTMPTHLRATKRGFVPRCYLVMEEQSVDILKGMNTYIILTELKMMTGREI